MCDPEELNQKYSLKYRVNLFSILMRVFNLNLVDAKCVDEKSKVFSRFFIVWITMANYLNFNIFICPIMTTQKEMFN